MDLKVGIVKANICWGFAIFQAVTKRFVYYKVLEQIYDVGTILISLCLKFGELDLSTLASPTSEELQL